MLRILTRAILQRQTAVFSGQGRIRSISTKPSTAELSKLPVTYLQQVLGNCGIDYRHCTEKRDLIELLSDNFVKLPVLTQAEVTDIVRAPPRDVVTVDARQALASRVSRLQADEQYIVRLFSEARPSVAHITSLNKASDPRSMMLNPNNMRPGTGSGFIWDTRGHVVTNFHVIMDAAAVKVTLSNQSTHDAAVVGADPANDVAVLRLQSPATALVPISVGTSHDLLVGQKVFAIGNPFGLDQTLTAGIIGSVNRQMQGVGQRVIRDVIQTDAAINPGNSGGPLLDSQGRLVGVNTMIYSPNGMGNIGIGFAVPVNTVRRSVSQIIQYGRVRRGRVGLVLLADETNLRLRHAYGLPAGVIVQEVVPSSGAAQANLRGFSKNASGELVLGDLVLAVGGEPVQSCEDIIGIVEQFNVGDQVPFTVRRGTTQMTVNVPVTEPEAFESRAAVPRR